MPDSTSETVSLDSITNAPVAPPSNGEPLPKNIDPFTGMRDERLDQHLGRVGKYIGGGPEKAGNIAYVVIIVALVLLIIGACVSAYAETEKLSAVYDRVVTGAFSLITGALGFLFGKSGGSKD
jgi:hypothetical protein